jgi:hypothetical protein
MFPKKKYGALLSGQPCMSCRTVYMNADADLMFCWFNHESKLLK